MVTHITNGCLVNRKLLCNAPALHWFATDSSFCSLQAALQARLVAVAHLHFGFVSVKCSYGNTLMTWNENWKT